MKNRYIRRSKISEAKFRKVVKLFALDLTATQITKLTGMNPNTIDLLMAKIRHRILAASRSEAPTIGEFEADESYFGPRRVKGKRGRGAGLKTIVFGTYKRNGKVYTEIVSNAKAQTLQAIIGGSRRY